MSSIRTTKKRVSAPSLRPARMVVTVPVRVMSALRTEDSEQPPEVSLDNRLHDLAGTLQESLSRLAPEATRSAPPKSFAELAGWLSQQHTTSTAILQGISQGAYASLGLSVVPSTPTPSK